MINIREDLDQGSEEWLQARCGLLTASEMKHIITPTLKIANNDKSRSHLYELLAQRITGYVEPSYISDDMLRGRDDELRAKQAYEENFAPVVDAGFITNDKFGFVIGYSPDGLVGDDGLIECKSRRQKYHVETILTHAPPEEHVIQLQTGLLVSERKWIDYVSYCGGLPMETIRVYPCAKIQDAIVSAATEFEAKMQEKMAEYKFALSSRRFVETKRVIIQEIF